MLGWLRIPGLGWGVSRLGADGVAGLAVGWGGGWVQGCVEAWLGCGLRGRFRLPFWGPEPVPDSEPRFRFRIWEPIPVQNSGAPGAEKSDPQVPKNPNPRCRKIRVLRVKKTGNRACRPRVFGGVFPSGICSPGRNTKLGGRRTENTRGVEPQAPWVASLGTPPGASFGAPFRLPFGNPPGASFGGPFRLPFRYPFLGPDPVPVLGTRNRRVGRWLGRWVGG